MVYLDYSASTPVSKSVLEKFNNDNFLYVGNANSMHKLGEIYEHELTTPNYIEALKWYSLAANNDYHKSIYKLGMFYLNGLGVEKNTLQAIEYFKEVKC